ncbi:TPA: PspC domain-containing protein, partial [Flavobacterium psychrophilum]
MTTIIRKREYWYLLIVILHFTIFHIIKQYLVALDAEIQNKIEILYSNVKSPTEEQYLPLFTAKDDISIYFSLIIIISSLIITSVLLSDIKIKRQYNFGKNKEKKIIGGVIAGFSSYFNINLILCRIVFIILIPSVLPILIYLFLWGLMPYTNYDTTNKKKVIIDNNGFLFIPLLFIYIVICFNDLLNYQIQDKYLMSYFIFLPYLYLIYDKIIIGKQVDITQEVKSKVDSSHKENLNDLDNLLKLDLISTEEYN